MTTSPYPVYLFRGDSAFGFAKTLVCVAPLDCVVSVYGGEGISGEEGLSAAFGGYVVYKNDTSGARLIGVWGARNASRFRSDLRAHVQITLLKEAPEARCILKSTHSGRPKVSRGQTYRGEC